MAILKLNNNSLTSVTELPSGVGSDPNTKISLARLGLRVFANQNLATSNTQNLSYDVFQDSTGITNLTNSLRNSSEFISSRSTSVSIGGSDEGFTTGDNYWQTISNFKFTSNNNQASNWQHNVNNLYDGATSANTSDATWPGATMTDSVYLDLTPTSTYQSGGTKVLSGIIIMCQSRNQTVSWQISGSNTLGGTYTNLGSAGSLGNGGNYDVTFVPTQTYDYYRITFPSGVNTSGYWQELYGNRRSLSTSTTLNATGSFEGVDITAPSSVSKMGAVITYEETGTNVLNTDIVMKLSADLSLIHI